MNDSCFTPWIHSNNHKNTSVSKQVTPTGGWREKTRRQESALRSESRLRLDRSARTHARTHTQREVTCTCIGEPFTSNSAVFFRSYPGLFTRVARRH
jgi:hypothetical protein